MSGGSVDFAILGAGVVGLTTALELRRRHPGCSVRVLEKEPAAGLHASGRNSGVLHAGFYYTAESLKARFCVEGSRRMREYCADRGLRVGKHGKLVVARTEDDHAGLDELLRRGAANGVRLQAISEAEAREIEPRVRTAGRAIWSPDTATVDPAEVMAALAADCTRQGVELRTSEPVLSAGPGWVRTPAGRIEVGHIVNAAGLYADRIARGFGFAADLEIIPFKGLYLYSDEPPSALRTSIYPVPDLRNPFLGVHFTVNVDGHAKVGPTAIPCFWREQYGWRERFRAGELAAVGAAVARLWLADSFGFRRLAAQEMRKYSRRVLVGQAAELATGVQVGQYRRFGRPGIRAQLLDRKRAQLIMDFRVEGDERSTHVLNAVSPAFTCSLAFADHVCDIVDRSA